MTRFHSFIAKVTMLSLVIGLVAVVPSAQAAALTSLSDLLSTQLETAEANHEINFTLSASGGGVAEGETITVTFNADFSLTGIIEDDIDIEEGGVDATTAIDCAQAGNEQIGVGISGQVITFTICAGDGGAMDASDVVTIEIGTNATSSGVGANQINNPDLPTAAPASYDIDFAGTNGDTGSIGVGITADDTVAISATVDPSLTFDLDTPAGGATCSDTTALTVGFGTVATSAVDTSGLTDAVERLCIDLATNADGGVTVTVDATGTGDLESASTSATIDSLDSATMAAGTENWGACIDTGAAGLTVDANWLTATCDLNGNTNDVGDFTGATQTIMTATGPVASGTTEMYFSMAISATTEAASDYVNTLTFVATGTF